MKIMGFECEKLYRSFFAKVPFVGEIWAETSAVVRGRWWADYLMEGGSLEFFFGSTYIVLSPSKWLLSGVRLLRRTRATQLPA